MTTGQIGLLLDIAGFVIIYFTGGFTLGISEYIKNDASKLNWFFRILGFVLVVAGFVLQFIAAGPHTPPNRNQL